MGRHPLVRGGDFILGGCTVPPLSAIEERFLKHWQREGAPAGGASRANILTHPDVYRQCFYSAARRISITEFGSSSFDVQARVVGKH